MGRCLSLSHRRFHESPRRLAGVSAEGGAERTGRAVADPRRHPIQRDAAAAQQVLGDGHAPCGQVFDRARADHSGEPLDEGRTGHSRLACEIGDGPGPGDIAMQAAQGAGDARIGQPAQEARMRRPGGGGAQRLDQQDLDQPFQDQFAAGLIPRRLVAQHPHQLRQTGDIADVDHPRQQRHQQRRVGHAEG